MPDLTAANDYRHMLLTGATGYLGAYLAAGLLENTKSHTFLPVRGASQEESANGFKAKWFFILAGISIMPIKTG